MVHALIFAYGQERDGSINEQTRDRCMAGLKLYRAGKVEKCYLTCGVEKNGVGMASAMREFLLGQGVSNETIITKPKGLNTAGEIDVFFSVVPSTGDLVFVSSWHHIPRIWWLVWYRISRSRRSWRTAAAWRHAHWKDLVIEPVKMLNAIIQPRRWSKTLPPSQP